jgi:hypothetical protein
MKVALDYEAGGRAWKGISQPKGKWELAQTAQFSKEWDAQNPRAWAKNWDVWNNNRKETFKQWGFSGKPKQARRSMRQQPTRADRAKLSEGLVQHLLNHDEQAFPPHADRKTKRLFVHIAPD